jgi:thiopeptide-type bacteriocin biosynthesis protein
MRVAVPDRMEGADVVAAPWFVLRTPLLPLDEWLMLGDEMSAPRAGEDALADALASDRERVRARLRTLVGRAHVREALFLASPSLDDVLDLWLRSPDSDRGLKAERSLVRYIARMCGRATPFGLFAGCTVGRVDVSVPTALAIAQRERYRRHTRLDMDYLFALCETLAADPELRQRLRYRPSSSLYRAAGRLRYVEARRVNRTRSYHLVAVEPTEYLERTLERARSGATLSDLADALVADGDVGEDEARGFVDELATTQLLVPELQPAVTGPEPIHGILQRLDGHRATDTLAAAQRVLDAIDREPLGIDTNRYRSIAESLRALPVEVELSRLFQADLFTAADEAVLGGAVVAELTRAVDLLHQLSRPRDPLRSFRDAFLARYERALVPLVEVLDDESGIGFGSSDSRSADASPLIATLPLRATSTRDRQVAWGERERLILDKLIAAAAAGERVIRLERRDLDAMASPSSVPLPDSFAVMATVLSQPGSDGDFLVNVINVVGPSSANLLGRFCHGDPRLDEFVREELRIEESARPDALFAEIVHLPEGRVGNVLLRPLLRRWELPLLGVSGAPAEAQLPITDLLVTVDGDRVVLRSRRLRREIVPRLTSAHNYTGPSSLGTYRFLCLLQAQGVTTGLAWDWGPLDSAPFLPRVMCGRIILAPSRWRLGRAHLEPLLQATDYGRWLHLQTLRRDLGLPRFVALQDGDNLLPIDLDQVLSVESVAHLVKGRLEAVLVESLAQRDQSVVRGHDGAYAHELIIPYRRRRAHRGASPAPGAPAVHSASALDMPRSLPPGGECLYLKVYAGSSAIDGILGDTIAPLLEAARASGAVRSWFFVRYGDPEWHLRLRFFGDPAQLRSKVLVRLTDEAAQAVRDGRIWRVQLDTYEREIERYGGSVGMRLCEQLFAFDSDAALAIVARLEGDAGADARWRLALLGIDRLLDDLGFPLEDKQRIVTDLRTAFAREFDVGPVEKALGERFRKERAALETLLAPVLDPAHPLAPGRAIFDERSRRQAPVAAALQAALADRRVNVPREALAASLVHMHVNRLLRSSARANELVLYDFLQRLYTGQRARSRTR